MKRQSTTDDTNLDTPHRLRVFLVDGDTGFVESAARCLKQQDDIQVVGRASDALEAISRVANLKPDVILLALDLSGLSGWEAIPHFHRAVPEAGIIAVTNRKHQYRSMAMWIGANDVVSRRIPEAHLLAIIRRAADRHGR